MRFCKYIMKNASSKPLSGAFLDLPLFSVRAHVTNVLMYGCHLPDTLSPAGAEEYSAV